jgi:hypothetical protein
VKAFLQRFALLVSGALRGFDRLVFKGKLRQLYTPEGMNILLGLNHVPRTDFKRYATQVTSQVLNASLISRAQKLQRYRYLNSSNIDKEEVARQFQAQHQVQEGLVCVLRCVEPCWTFDTARDRDDHTVVKGERGKCSYLYHYYMHPRFGWMYVRLQTWFPFEIQVGINGREWLARQMDRECQSQRKSEPLSQPGVIQATGCALGRGAGGELQKCSACPSSIRVENRIGEARTTSWPVVMSLPTGREPRDTTYPGS